MITRSEKWATRGVGGGGGGYVRGTKSFYSVLLLFKTIWLQGQLYTEMYIYFVQKT